MKSAERKQRYLKKNLKTKNDLKESLSLNREDMPINDKSVKFYTGLPNLACFNFTLNLIQQCTEKIKYWDKKKETKSHYQGDVSKRMPGRNRPLTVKEEYLVVLCRLHLGLLNQHLGEIFGVSESTICKTFTTGVCLPAKIFNGTLLRWPSRGIALSLSLDIQDIFYN